MDKIEGSVLVGMPVHALSLNLTRSTIRMLHSNIWRIDKTNSYHDLVICLSGSGQYVLDDEEVILSPGHAMLIPAGTRFIGRHHSGSSYTGIAQHFSLDLFGHLDLISQMTLKRSVKLSKWKLLHPIVEYYRESALPSSTSLMQHHLFMFLLIEYLEDAFIEWKENPALSNHADGLSLSIMLAATQISADPLQEGITDKVLKSVPYNLDYFNREFRKQIGWTPHKFQEYKRMERAMVFLEAGRSVKEAAASVGYLDPYYFSRMFKRYVGISPTGYKTCVQESRDGTQLPGEDVSVRFGYKEGLASPGLRTIK